VAVVDVVTGAMSMARGTVATLVLQYVEAELVARDPNALYVVT
jgi:hypothetical protein